MNWVLLIGSAWLAVAVLVGVVIGRGIRLADRKEEEAVAAEAAAPNFVVDSASVAEPPAPAGPPDSPADVSAPAAVAPEAAIPDRVRHSIPTARPAAVRAPVHASERTPSQRDSDQF
jgi:predicted lipid-binding transport protein (Tim44 family)